jgi:hypothetical protein
VAAKRALTAREHGGHAATALGEETMPEREHASMHDPEPASLDPATDRPVAGASLQKLPAS